MKKVAAMSGHKVTPVPFFFAAETARGGSEDGSDASLNLSFDAPVFIDPAKKVLKDCMGLSF